MGRRRTVRATPATYVPFGAPEEVRIERVDYGHGPRGVRQITWVETRPGVSLDSKTAHDTLKPERQELWHPNGCAGAAGVARLWWRGGEGFCAADYELKFDCHPALDDLLEDPPANWR